MKTHPSKKYPQHYSTLFIWLSITLLLFSSWRIIEHKQYEENDDLIVDYYPSPNDKIEQTYQYRPEPQKPKPIHIHLKTELTNLIEKTTENIDVQPNFLPITVDKDPPIQPDNIITSIPGDDGDDNVVVNLIKLEQMPVFPGCEKYKGDNDKLKTCLNRKIKKFLLRKINRDLIEELNEHHTISVYVSFIIDENGQITTIKTRSQYKNLARETKRVLSKLPQMEPGIQRFKKVKVQYFLPIQFQLK